MPSPIHKAITIPNNQTNSDHLEPELLCPESQFRRIQIQTCKTRSLPSLSPPATASPPFIDHLSATKKQETEEKKRDRIKDEKERKKN
jgi:hypothetical protein